MIVITMVTKEWNWLVDLFHCYLKIYWKDSTLNWNVLRIRLSQNHEQHNLISPSTSDKYDDLLLELLVYCSFISNINYISGHNNQRASHRYIHRQLGCEKIQNGAQRCDTGKILLENDSTILILNFWCDGQSQILEIQIKIKYLSCSLLLNSAFHTINSICETVECH